MCLERDIVILNILLKVKGPYSAVIVAKILSRTATEHQF